MSVPALCCGGKELKELAPGCIVTVMPEDIGGDHVRRWVRLARFEVPGGYLPMAHHDCLHNQYAAIRNRVLGVVPRPTLSGLSRLRKQARMMSYFLPEVTADDWYVMPNNFSGSKRAKYTRATDDVLATGLTRKDARIKMFVKFEKLSSVKVNPDPRAIQFRHPRYCVVLGRYLKPIEHRLYQLRGDGVILPSSRVIGKGLSMAGRARLLQTKMEGFQSPCVVSLDASRFDQHVDKELLKIEHSIYLRMCPDKLFESLLSWQLENECVSSKGIRYRASGKRMSGDMNTALGNCVLMVLMVSDFMRGRKYDILDDGDDCLLIVEEDTLQWVLDNVEAGFLEYGHEIKIENVARSLEEVEWCQCKPIVVKPGCVKFVRSPAKMLSTSLCGSKYFTSEGARRKLVNTIGMAELVLNLGVPVLQEFATMMMRSAGTDKFIQFDEVDGMYHRIKHELRALNLKTLERLKPNPITDEARLSFSAAFGISIQEQLDMEEYFRRVVLRIDGLELLTDDVDVHSWTLNAYHTPELYSMRE